MPDLRDACADVRDAGPADAVDGVAPRQVVRPGSTGEVAAVLAAAAAHGHTVVARGAGSKLTWGRPPRRVDVVVDLSRLDRIVDHAAGDLVVVAQAGVPMAILQRHVAGAAQRLAVDGDEGTVGGAVATNATGPLRLLAGTVRDLLIGVTIVRADGTVARSGGRVVKNVAGYDLGKLVTGSYGTLAVITEAIFRLHPLPAAAATVTAPVPDPAAAAELVRAMARAQVAPSAVELDHPVAGPGSLAVRIEGIGAGVAARAAATATLIGGTVAAEPDWWGRHPWSAGDAALKLTFLRAGLPAVLAAARRVGVAVRGSAAVGVLYGAAPPDSAERAVTELRAICAAHGGALVVLDAPPAVKATLDVWGPVAGLDLMRRVKDRFDPEHRLAPGRFVGGI